MDLTSDDGALLDEAMASAEPVAVPAAVRSGLLDLVREIGDLDRLKPVLHGISARVIAHNRDRITVLMKFEAGAVMPAHGHIGEEHSFVVDGSCRIGDTSVTKGDFHIVAAGTRHGDVISDGGCVLLISMDARDYKAA